MSKIAVLCNDGVEEIECLTVVDFCRRAGIEVTTVSVTGKRQIMGAHKIMFHADEVYADMNFDEFDGIVYPGGPGTGAMGEKPGVKELAQKFLNHGKLLAAIGRINRNFKRKTCNRLSGMQTGRRRNLE